MFWKKIKKKKRKKYREERNLKLIRANHFRYCKINCGVSLVQNSKSMNWYNSKNGFSLCGISNSHARQNQINKIYS